MVGGSAPMGKAEKVQTKVYDHITVFLCVPLRTAVVMIGVSSVFLGFCLLVDRVGTEDSLRQYVGGYTMRSRTVIGLVDFLGLFWGLLGIAGAWQLRSSYIKLFMGYQAVRLLAWIWMYFADLPLLWNCELWTKDVTKAAGLYSWNDVMFNVSVEDKCPSERFDFLLRSIPTLLFALYCMAVTQWMLADMEDELAYLFKVPMGATSGAFYTRSLASKSLREQMHEEAEKATMAAEAKRRVQEEDFMKRVGFEMEKQPIPGFAPPPPLAPPPLPQFGTGAQPAAPVWDGWPLGAQSVPAGFVPPQFGSAPPTPAGPVSLSVPAGFFRPAADDGMQSRMPYQESFPYGPFALPGPGQQPGLQPPPQGSFPYGPFALPGAGQGPGQLPPGSLLGGPPSQWVREVV
mmetsp:Transcript_47319/g.135657  ORF Transcript_47319/g.135657 Transcript_47319/m.135657 type:complete len:402 (+) Transcript_47319:157-1362(+)